MSACSSDDVVNGDDDDDGDRTPGDVTLEVSGAVEGECPGEAVFNTLAGAAHFVTFTFDDGEGSGSMTLEGLAGEGNYEIGQTTNEPAKLELTLDDIRDLEGAISGLVLIETGSVTITDFGDNRIEGKFSGTGETGATGNPSVTVAGDFVATCFEAPGLTCQ